MRVLVASALIAFTACAPGTATQPSPAAASSSPVAHESPLAASPAPFECSLPVWWDGVGADVHAGFLSVPDGTFKDAGVLPYPPRPDGLGGAYGATYDATKDTWIRAARPASAPDRSRYAYWTAGPSSATIHVVDVATGADHVAYSGTIPYIIVGFESDAIYLAHIINARQGAFELLYRLNPAGGTPTLVPGSDRHMYQWGWVLIADGAAWGIDNHASGNDYTYSVLRLDLTTAQITDWIEGTTLLWPQGVDGSHRLYAAAYSGPLMRVDGPGHAVQLASPSQVFFSGAIGGPSGFAADSRGVWFAGQGSVWRYRDGQSPQQFTVGPATEDVYPAGSCLS